MNTFENKNNIKNDIEFFQEIGKAYGNIVYNCNNVKNEVKERYIYEIIKQKDTQGIVKVLKKVYKNPHFYTKNRQKYIQKRIRKFFEYKMSKKEILFNLDCEMALFVGILDYAIPHYEEEVEIEVANAKVIEMR